MKCLTSECEFLEPWGVAVPNKAKCLKPPVCESGFRYSVVIGARCSCQREWDQSRLFDVDSLTVGRCSLNL